MKKEEPKKAAPESKPAEFAKKEVKGQEKKDSAPAKVGRDALAKVL